MKSPGHALMEVLSVKVVNLYKLAIKLLKRQAEENPGKKFTNSEGESATIRDVADSLEKVVSWIHPELLSQDIQAVVRCKRCVHYKAYRKKGESKGAVFRACDIDHMKRDPMFFCKDGEEP